MTKEWMERIRIYCNHVGEDVTLNYKIIDRGEYLNQGKNDCAKMGIEPGQCNICTSEMKLKRSIAINEHFKKYFVK
ncbi:MAG: hypothetical protein ACYDG6_06765 [Thermincolia bacterium]